MNLQNWIDQARRHWEEFRPTLYRDLKTSGKLDAALRDAADRTDREMNDLREHGYTEQEAWEMVRERYLFPPEQGDISANDLLTPTSESGSTLTDLLHAAIKSGAREIVIPRPGISTAAEFKKALKDEL
jgi:hypothetical protein